MDYILKHSLSVPMKAEHNSNVEHKEHQDRITSVSHLYEKYRTGKIEDMPTSRLPQMPDDDRTDDEMLQDDFVLGLGKDELDLMNRYKEVSDRLRDELDKLKLNAEKKKSYEDALRILDDPNSKPAQRAAAYHKIEELRHSARAT